MEGRAVAVPSRDCQIFKDDRFSKLCGFAQNTELRP